MSTVRFLCAGERQRREVGRFQRDARGGAADPERGQTRAAARGAEPRSRGARAARLAKDARVCTHEVDADCALDVLLVRGPREAQQQLGLTGPGVADEQHLEEVVAAITRGQDRRGSPSEAQHFCCKMARRRMVAVARSGERDGGGARAREAAARMNLLLQELHAADRSDAVVTCDRHATAKTRFVTSSTTTP